MKHLRNSALAAFATILLLGASGLAHDRDSNMTKQAVYQSGYDRGYSDGSRHGTDDQRRGRGSDYRSDEYNRADRGFRSSMGHEGDYKKGYREGYKTGYREGYGNRGYSSSRSPNRYPSPERYPYPDSRYPGSRDRYPDSRYPDSRYPGSRYPDRVNGNGAFQAGQDRGYRDGLDEGRSDVDKNKSYDINRHDNYRDADKGYNSRYGDKQDYRSGYREGFRSGYDAAFGTRRSGQIWRR